ncbi:hypothetical protein D1872_354560 [compost metagenome]
MDRSETEVGELFGAKEVVHVASGVALTGVTVACWIDRIVIELILCRFDAHFAK